MVSDPQSPDIQTEPEVDDDPYSWAADEISEEDSYNPDDDGEQPVESVPAVGEATEEPEPKREADDEPVPKNTAQTEASPAETTDDEPEEEGKEESPEPKEEKVEPITDDTEIDVDGTKVSVADLKEAFSIVDKAKDAYREAQQRTEQVNKVTENLVKNPLATLIQMYTEISKNPQTAYAHVLGLAEEMVAKHLEWEATPEEKRRERQLQADRDRLQRELEAARSQQTKAEEERQLQAAEAEIRADITDALKNAKVDVDDDAISGVAAQLLAADDQGISITTARAVQKYLKAEETKRAALLKKLKPEDLPAEVRKKANLDAAKAKRSPKTGGDAKRKKQKAAPVINMSDYQDWLAGKIDDNGNPVE